MRVLIANKFFFQNGGSEVVMFQEREYLQKNGVDVIDFSMVDPRNWDSPYSAHFVASQSYDEANQSVLQRTITAARLIHSSEAVRKIGELIDRERPDIVHCHNIYHQLTPSIIGAAKRRKVPVVLTLHDYKTVCPVYARVRAGQLCSDCLEGDFFNVVRNRCADGSLAKSALLYAEAAVQRYLGNYESVDVILAPSRFMAESVTKARFRKERVRVLYNGIDTRGIPVSVVDGNYILYVGRLSEQKGVQTLLEAHSMMAQGIQMIVAGTGPLEEELRARYRRARFLGFLSGDDLSKTIAGASVVVVPSEGYENCPMSVLEAMAAARAVVASDIGGIPELVLNRETGLLFEPGKPEQLRQCLEEIMGNPALRIQLGAAGRTRAQEHFSADEHNRKLMQIYQGLL
jgi:glycosyltransferase involved in cell wall biosynthesis